LIGALIGIALGIFTILFARSIRGERWVYSLGLLTLPSLYGFFALRAGEHAVGLNELIYGLPYLAAGLIFVFVSVPQSALVVGSLWILHGLYDVTHDRFISNAGVPAWYPAFCFAVDVVIGAYVVWLSRRLPDGNLRKA
jgi:hypothetical protein